jgi:hypothetical protein
MSAFSRAGVVAAVIVAACATAPVPPEPAPPPHVQRAQLPEPAVRCEGQGSRVLVQGAAVASAFLVQGGPVLGAPLLARVALPASGARAALFGDAIVTVEPGALAFTTADGSRRVPLESPVGLPAGVAVRPGGTEAVLWAIGATEPVVVVDPDSGRTLRTLSGHEVPVADVLLGPRGLTVTIDAAGWVRLFDATRSSAIARLRPIDGAPVDAAIAGAWLMITAGAGARLLSLDPPGPAGEAAFGGAVTSLGSDGERFVVGLASGAAVVVDPATKRGVAAFDATPAADLCLAAGWLAAVGADLSLVPPDLGATPPAVTWIEAAPANPVEAISDDTFTALYHALRCAQAQGDARRVVNLLESYGVPDLPAWARASGVRLQQDGALLRRLADETAKPCP